MSDAPRLDPDPRGRAIFLLAAAVHTALLARFGRPPSNPRLDINNYLELALNLLREGTYGSHLSRAYPPLYPMVVAPTFAIDSNAVRFGVLFAGHGVLLALGCLAMYGMLRSALGSRAAWLSLAAAQFLAGATYHGLAARSEALFTALICMATGALWAAFHRPRAWRWVLVGVLCGLAIACRRTGLVLPAAVGVVVAVEARGADGLAAGLRRVATRAALLAVGLAIGLIPEGVAAALHGGKITTYHEGVVGSHLSPMWRMWETWEHLEIALRTWARQPLYTVLAFGAAPVVIAAVLASRRRVSLPSPLAATAGFALLVTLGLAALSSLHILRYAYGNPDAGYFHLYPRYMDPAEPAVVLAAVALAGAAWRMQDKEAVRRTLTPWILPLALAAWASGPMWRVRGGRVPSGSYFKLSPLTFELYPAIFMAAVVLALLVAFAWWSAGRYGTPATVAGVVAVGWVLSLQVPLRIVERGDDPYWVASVLELAALQESPAAPIAVPVNRLPHRPRDLYTPAFRSDHPVYWPRKRDLAAWLAEHPDGFVLTRRWEPAPGHRLNLELVGIEGKWALWAPRGREKVPPDLLDAQTTKQPKPREEPVEDFDDEGP